MVMDVYTPTVFVNDSAPSLDADNMNKNEQQTKNLTDALRNVQISLESGQFKQALDQVKQLAEDAAKTAEWSGVSGKPEFLQLGTTATTAMAGNTALLKLGTTSTTAKAGDYKPAWGDVSGKPVVIASGADQAAARASIGAGTSSIKIGTTATDAKAGNAIQTATQTTATAVGGGTATNVQGILGELAARIAALETP